MSWRDDDRLLDALCAAWLLGTMRGGARRRFEVLCKHDARVGRRLEYWQRRFSPAPAPDAATAQGWGAAEIRRGWHRLEADLGLAPARPRASRLARFWQIATGLSTAALLFAVFLLIARPPLPTEPPAQAVAWQPLATLAAQPVQGVRPEAAGASAVTIETDATRSRLLLRPARPTLAGPVQSFELWLLPADGSAPRSIAVVGDLDASVPLAQALRDALVAGASLALSVEPAGGSPTGAPTGPVIFAGPVRL